MCKEEIGMSALEMSRRIMYGINTTLTFWHPRKKYTIDKIKVPEKSYNEKLNLKKYIK